MATTKGTSHVYGIDQHTLSLTALSGPAATSGGRSSRFALSTLGTTSSDGHSEIHIISFNDPDQGDAQDTAALTATKHKHTAGLLAIHAVPWIPTQLVAVTGVSGTMRDSVLQVVELEGDHTNVLATLNVPEGCVRKAAVWPIMEGGGRIGVLSDVAIHVYDLDGSSFKSVWSVPQDDPPETLACHPSSAFLLSTTDGTALRSWDTRQPPTSHATVTVECAHQGRIRALDYNPNVPHIVATGGDDGIVRLWDARRMQGPVTEVSEHSCWVYSVRFNPHHDQLLLTAGADGLVNLESVVSWSFARQVGTAATAAEEGDEPEYDEYEEEGERAVDGLVAQFDDHETSVYAAVWSVEDPWVFASLSFDGRLVINTVPREEKYKILL
ncbi:Protein tssc1 [Kickxella alabastrina]|uniref:Protein tssc1 n=1 Tax=Kickxella alabastrina TaxID=61397 RepID=A0ACC1HYZ3_9FUNG|nr:Protein tssc1 [Kickxella alabastrina]